MTRPRLFYSIGGLALLALALAALLAGRPSAQVPRTAGEPPRFVDEALVAGVEHRYDGDFEFFVGGGVAVLDCDADGRPDLYLAGGAESAALYRNRSEAGGELWFEQLPDGVTDLTDVTGAYPLDLDADGHPDLVVLRRGENVLLRGLGDCRFERANEAWGFDGGGAWTAAFSATWEDEAGFPTLAFGNYLDEASTDRERRCHDNVLVRPAAAGGFEAPVPLGPGWCALSMLFSDWSGSGGRDLRVSNDRHYYSDYGDGQEQLWRIEPGVEPRLYTAEEGWQTLRIFGMGIASHDLTGDGRPEVYLTSIGDNKLQQLTDGPSRPTYGDIALSRGVTAHRPYAGDEALPSTAWHAEFGDVNNDGFIDLFVAKGNIEVTPEHAARDPNNLLLGQADGSFVESGHEAGIVTWARARGAALVDLNQDGRLDLVVVNRRENIELWRNVGPAGNWLAVRLEQRGGNRDAIGAWIEVRVGDWVRRHELSVGGGHAGGQLGWTHIGLGPADEVEVTIRWPDGTTEAAGTMAANQQVVIRRGETDDGDSRR